MATTALYRRSSNEVVKVSLKAQPFDSRDDTYWGVLTDPALPDGSATREKKPDGTMGPLRELGFAKIFVPPNTVRNATQAEIDTFAPYEAADEALMDRDAAKDLLQAHPRFRKVLVAMADIIKDEINILRAEHGLAPRTLLQFKNAMLNRISEGD